MARLSGKIALITGGAAGIGLQTAHLFLKEGAKLALVDLDQAELDKAAEDLGQPEDVLTIAADVASAGQGGGSIINMSSIAGLKGSPNLAPYITSKHAVVGMTRAAAIEAAPANVRVNSVHPSPINTRMMRSLEDGFSPGHGGEVKAQLEQSIPLGRYGEATDVANLVLFLASDESRFITGAQYPVDGGMAAG